MSNYNDFMIDFACPACGDSADERGCINGCDVDDFLASAYAGDDPYEGAEDAAMESSLFGDC